MAVTQAAASSLTDVVGTAVYDSALGATAVCDTTQDVVLRQIVINNAAVAGAAWLQIFAKFAPTLGTDWADHGIPVPASKIVLVTLNGDCMEFDDGYSYALTDAAHGSSLTGAARGLAVGRD